MDTITRKEALTIGQKWYFTGVPCSHGHISKRGTVNRRCYECGKVTSKTFRDKNEDYHHQYNKKYYPKNKERTAELSNAYYSRIKEESPELLKGRQRLNSVNYIKNNKEIVAKRGQQWCVDNRGLRNAMTARRRTKKINATPPWANHPKIKDIYLECADINTMNRMCGGTGKFVVDHIIPLQGENVSGLHVAGNLQIITERENAIKSNKFNGEEFLNES